jgi:plastocyanin
MKPMTLLYGFLYTLCAAGFAHAEDHVVGQKNKQFTASTIEIKKGDSIRFTNEDSFFHNVFSLSDTKSFDLGSYPQGEYKAVTFDRPGIVEVECAIHPSMHMTVIVKE